jgi:inorganic pyrophosphatase
MIPQQKHPHIGANRHMSIGQTVKVIVDRPMGSYHPTHKDLYYPVNYGYIPGIFAPDGEEQDAYILGISEPVTEFVGQVIAVIHRYDDIEEKWVVAPVGMTFTKEEIAAQTAFQEQYFKTEIRMEKS